MAPSAPSLGVTADGFMPVTRGRRPQPVPEPAVAQPAPTIRTPALARLSGAPKTTRGLQFVSSPLGAVSEVEPQAIATTYWFTAPAGPKPYQVAVRFTGHRLDVAGARTEADDFQVETRLDTVQPSSGPISLTQRITGKRAGTWKVTADAVAAIPGAEASNVLRLPSVEGVGRSTFAPVAMTLGPGVVPGSWPAMVLLGFGLALAVVGALTGVHGLATGRVLLLALAAGVLGLVGAKVYYWLTHPHEKRTASLTGLSLQGFVITVLTVFALGGWALGVRVGHLLDASIPALLVGQAVGRLGCLFAGCCSGLPNASRWAIWSSDRRVGTRRIPVQLVESFGAALVALVTGLVAWRTPPQPAGFLFLSGLAAYVLVRQILFPLRGLPRATKHGRTVMLVIAPAVLASAIAVLALS